MKTNKAILLLGSNINPEQNIQAALELLPRYARIQGQSQIWETESVGSQGPNFLNLAVCILTKLNPTDLKLNIISPIEKELKRVRTQDRYAPRTIDIDLIVYNEEVFEDNLWQRAFIALPVSELAPNLTPNNSSITLKKQALKLKRSVYAEPFSSK